MVHEISVFLRVSPWYYQVWTTASLCSREFQTCCCRFDQSFSLTGRARLAFPTDFPIQEKLGCLNKPYASVTQLETLVTFANRASSRSRVFFEVREIFLSSSLDSGTCLYCSVPSLRWTTLVKIWLLKRGEVSLVSLFSKWNWHSSSKPLRPGISYRRPIIPNVLILRAIPSTSHVFWMKILLIIPIWIVCETYAGSYYFFPRIHCPRLAFGGMAGLLTQGGGPPNLCLWLVCPKRP